MSVVICRHKDAIELSPVYDLWCPDCGAFRPIVAGKLRAWKLPRMVKENALRAKAVLKALGKLECKHPKEAR